MLVTKVLTIGNAPINIATGTIAAFPNTQPVWARSFSAQMVHGGTSLGYWLQALNGRVPSKTAAGDLVEELYQASAASPGGIAWYTPDTSREGDQDVNTYWIDGDHTGDKVAITYDLVV